MPMTMPAHQTNLSLLDAARQWYDAGYAVIPSHEDGGKRPFGAWKQYQQERPTWQMVTEWLNSGRYTGIGVITGKVSGNVEMIELEGPQEQAVLAVHALYEQAEEYAGVDMPQLLRKVLNGCVERSAGGGMHLFVRIADRPVQGNMKLANDADGKVVAETRGEGGFVIVAPTPARTGHDDDAIYMLLNERSPERTVTITYDDLETLHYLVSEALHSHADGINVITPPESQNTPSTPPAAPQGQTGALTPWDDYANRTTWADILTPHGWQAVFTAPDGRTHWTRPGKSPNDGTSATTIEDGPLYVFSTSTSLPAGVGMSKQHVYALLHHGGDHTAATRSLSAQGYGDKDIGPTLPPWEVDLGDVSAEQVKDAKKTWVREHLPILDWAALWADETQEEWIVEPLLAKRRLVALYSAPKVGKSLLMLELAASMASGKPVLGNPATDPIRTLYIDFENDPRGDIRERLRAMDFEPDDLENLCYLSYPTLAKLDTAQGAEQLMAAVDEYNCEVVVIDTVSRSVQGDENENDTWLAFYRHTGLLMKQKEIAMIRLDHSGKDESKGQRGGSAKSGDVDAVWQMKKISDNGFRLTCEANRFPIPEQVLNLERVESPRLHHKIDMQARKTAISEMCRKYAKAGVPRDRNVGPAEAKRIMDAAGVKFSKSYNTNATLEEYLRELPAFEPQELTA
jgi:hypothetical protein